MRLITQASARRRSATASRGFSSATSSGVYTRAGGAAAQARGLWHPRRRPSAVGMRKRHRAPWRSWIAEAPSHTLVQSGCCLAPQMPDWRISAGCETRQSFGKRAGAHARRESKRIRAMGQKRETPSRQARQGAQGFTFWSRLHVPAGPTINGRQMGKAKSEQRSAYMQNWDARFDL